jgi:predicted nucleic acid-binding protein
MKPYPGARIIVANTGPLIALARLDQLELLTALFSKIHIPQIVLSEASVNTEYAEAEPILSFAIQHASVEQTIDNDFNKRLLATREKRRRLY